MPHDNQNLCGLQRQASADHMLDQRASTRAMQHLRKLGTHPRPLTRGKYHDSCVGMVWHRPLLWRALQPLAMAKPNGIAFVAPVFGPAGVTWQSPTPSSTEET